MLLPMPVGRTISKSSFVQRTLSTASRCVGDLNVSVCLLVSLLKSCSAREDCCSVIKIGNGAGISGAESERELGSEWQD